MWSSEKNHFLMQKRKEAYEGGGLKRIAKQHEKGKLTARERIQILFDENTFTEIMTLMQPSKQTGQLPFSQISGDGVVVGYGKIGGRPAYAAAQDFTVLCGSLGEWHANKICRIIDMAIDAGAPFIMLNDSGGARIEEGVSSLHGYGNIFLRNTRASGVIPQIAVIMGPCAGGACYSPALCDFIFMVEKSSQMFLTGPKVIEKVTQEKVSAEELGGALVHTQKSGTAHFSYKDEQSCLMGVRKLLSYLPQSCYERPPVFASRVFDHSSELSEIVPENPQKTYNVLEVITRFSDENSFFEIQSLFARNIVIGFSRIDGKTTAIIANQPNYMGGALDYHASDKAARFVRFCDCFHIPIITLVDVPAFLPGKDQETNGIIRHGAKMLYAYGEATVPKITLIMRKAYGGAYIAMNSKGEGADLVFAWPTAELAVLGEKGAVDILYQKELNTSEEPENLRKKLEYEYRSRFISPYPSAERGYIDEVISVEETGQRLRDALEFLKGKEKNYSQRKHGNMPL